MMRIAPPAKPITRQAGCVPEGPAARYAELTVTSNFTFLTGASHPEELVQRAGDLGHAVATIADTNTLAGIVRAHVAAKEAGVPLAVGCRLRLSSPEGLEVVVYPTDRAAYARLCRLLTLGKRRAPKGECHLTLDDLTEHAEGLLAIAIPPDELDNVFAETLVRLLEVFDSDRLSLAAAIGYGPCDHDRVRHLAALSADTGVPLVGTNAVLYHAPERRPLQDVLTCVRHGCTIHEAGFRLQANAERHLKPAQEMARLFADFPGACARSVEVARRASAFSLDELRYEYPAEPCPAEMTPAQYLRQRVFAGAARRYPGGVPARVRQSIEDELVLIAELKYEPYFLTCDDIVAFARSRGIQCQGRGGAANSAVCYCLGVTEVDPARFALLFARFVSRERGEPPDIDIDFEHERREEVIQYIYAKYGRDRAALTAEVISYRGRSAIREVGKAMGLSLDAVDTLAKAMDLWGGKPDPARIAEAGFDPRDRTMRQVLSLTNQLIGFPRHLSQHVGGFVITRGPLCELVPIENAAMDNRTVIEWDKDDIDAMGMLKVDCLGLGMLTCIRKSFELIGEHRGRELSIPGVLRDHAEDPGVYGMIQRADTVGVFQIESRAQMLMLPRLKPKTFYDLVIEIAIVRPGPIQGKMVHPYLRRRNGEEPVEYPNPEIEEVLGRTLGVPLFQEQAMRMAIVAAGFTPDEADGLRRAMAAWKRKGDAIFRLGERLVSGMLERGYSQEFADRCFEQIKGFSEYGFPESHAASFALLVYVSCWLKHYEPAAFAAALINSQPMGFYRPAQIVRDAQEHGVMTRPVDVNQSGWDCALEDGGDSIRLGMRLVKGLGETDGRKIEEVVRTRGAFSSVGSLWRASGASVRAMRRLAEADAFGSMGLDRRAALWAIRPLRDESLPLFEQHEGPDTDGAEALPETTPHGRMAHDYQSTGLSLKAHPVSFVRAELRQQGAVEAAELRNAPRCPPGRRVCVAGVVLVRQRPATASGVVFITLEDETGTANLVVWPKVYDRYRRVVRLSTALVVHGRIEREGIVVHVHADRIESLDNRIETIGSRSRDFH
ncbi:MAG: error-prone DNA polymerase [Phycisphaerales bacterium]|jgi:error-prone DNA polymerase